MAIGIALLIWLWPVGASSRAQFDRTDERDRLWTSEDNASLAEEVLQLRDACDTLTSLLADPSQQVRCEAARALADVRCIGAGGAPAEVAGCPPGAGPGRPVDAETARRVEAAAALGRAGGEAAGKLIGMISRETDSLVLRESLTAFAHLRQRELAALLETIRERGEAWEKETAIAKALARLAAEQRRSAEGRCWLPFPEERALDLIVSLRRAPERLAEIIKDPEARYEVRAAAVRALGQFAVESARRELAAIEAEIEKDNTKSFSPGAIAFGAIARAARVFSTAAAEGEGNDLADLAMAMLREHAPKEGPAPQEVLDEHLRIEAAHALSTVSTARLAEFADEIADFLTQHERLEVASSQWLVSALARGGKREHLPLILRGWYDFPYRRVDGTSFLGEDCYLAIAEAYWKLALAGMTEQQAIDELIKRLDPEYDPYWGLVHSVGRLVSIGPPAIPALRAVVRDTGRPPRARGKAVGCLGRMRDAGSVELLCELAADETEERKVRCQAVVALGAIGGAEAEGTLLAMLPKSLDDPPLGQLVALALGDIGSKRAQAALVELLERKGVAPRIKKSAGLVLRDFGPNERVYRALVALGKDPDEPESTRGYYALYAGFVGPYTSTQELLQALLNGVRVSWEQQRWLLKNMNAPAMLPDIITALEAEGHAPVGDTLLRIVVKLFQENTVAMLQDASDPAWPTWKASMVEEAIEAIRAVMGRLTENDTKGPLPKPPSPPRPHVRHRS